MPKTIVTPAMNPVEICSSGGIMSLRRPSSAAAAYISSGLEATAMVALVPFLILRVR